MSVGRIPQFEITIEIEFKTHEALYCFEYMNWYCLVFLMPL